jgi:hypothetical protein
VAVYWRRHERGRVRDHNSPRISCAKRAANAVSFLVPACADREFIVDIGEKRDGCVDPSHDAAAELKQRSARHKGDHVRPRIDRVGVRPPILPEIAPYIRLPHLTVRGHDCPFATQSKASVRPRRVAERDFPKAIVALPEADFLPGDLSLRLKHEAGPQLRKGEGNATLQRRDEARTVGVEPGELGGGRAAIAGPLQNRVEIPAAWPDVGPVCPSRPGVDVGRSCVGVDIRGRRRIGDEAVDVRAHIAIGAIEAYPFILACDQRAPQKVDAALEAAQIAAGMGISKGLIAVVDRLSEETAPEVTSAIDEVAEDTSVGVAQLRA